MFVATLIMLGMLLWTTSAAVGSGDHTRPSAFASSSGCPNSNNFFSSYQYLFYNGNLDSELYGTVCWNGKTAWEAPWSPLNDSTIFNPLSNGQTPTHGCAASWILGRHPAGAFDKVYWCGVVGNHTNHFAQGINFCLGYGVGVAGNKKPAYMIFWGRYTVSAQGIQGSPLLETVAARSYTYGHCPSLAKAGGTPKPAAPTTGWATVPASGPSGLSTGSFTTGNMTCVSTTNCVLGGYLQGEQGYEPLLWHWNGRSWAFNPGHQSGSRALVGSACGSPSSCWAVGGQFQGNTPSALIEHFNGSSWSEEKSPADSAGVALNGVACVDASECFATGNQQTTVTTAHVMIERWNGRSWAPMSAPSPPGAMWSLLNSASCYGPDDCLASGDAYDSPTQSGYFFTEKYDGHSWALQSTGNALQFDLGNETGLFGIGCISESKCLAVGSALGYTAGPAQGANFPGGAAEMFNGSSWQPVKPTPDSPDLLNGIACLTDSYCWLTLTPGPPQNPVQSKIVLGFWDGSHITEEHLAQDGSMDAIACLPGGWCMALGEGAGATASSPPVMLAEEADPAPTASFPGKPKG
jgi:hypothetical protein